MSGKNKKIRKQLERIYGKECMFEKARIAEKIEKMGGIKTYATFYKEKVFKGVPIVKQLTLHHLQHRSENGATSMYNGALIDITPHQYIHSLPREQEEIINGMLRNYKVNFIVLNNLEVEQSGSINLNLDFEDCMEIPVYDNTPYINPHIKYKDRPKPFNRAKTKEKTIKEIDEYWEGDER